MRASSVKAEVKARDWQADVDQPGCTAATGPIPPDRSALSQLEFGCSQLNAPRGVVSQPLATSPPGGEVGISITSVERADEEEIGEGGSRRLREQSARAGIGLAADERALVA